MIMGGAVWAYSYNPKNRLKDKNSCGKWVVRIPLDQIDEFFSKVNNLVLEGKVYAAKISHKRYPNNDPLPHFLPVLCVYADDVTKDSALKELLKIGIKPSFWKYDWQTNDDWKPGGILYEESKRQRTEYFKNNRTAFEFDTLREQGLI
ncbi:MAG: hypothetical protein ABIH63_00470 [archaeon]